MGKVLLLARPARGLPRTGEKEENCSSRGVDVVLRSKIRDIRVLLFVKCSSPSKEINKPFLVLLHVHRLTNIGESTSCYYID